MAIVVPIEPVGCSHCDRYFSTGKAAVRHEKKDHTKCKQCKEKFSGLETLQSHQRVEEHCYCSQCDVYFKSIIKHITHLRDGAHENLHHCCDCGRDYSNRQTLKHHCCDCDRSHRSQNALETYVHSKAHKHKVEQLRPSNEHRCEKCSGVFGSQKELNKHVRSTHNGRHIECPVGKRCTKMFKTPSGLMNHLESGSCSSGLTGSRIQQLVATHDPERYITSLEALDVLETTEVMSQTSASQTYHSHLVESSVDEDGDISPQLQFADHDSLSEWSDLGGAPLMPTTVDVDWSSIGDGAMTPFLTDTASEMSFGSDNVMVLSSNAFSSSNINLELGTREGPATRGWRCQLCGSSRKPFGSAKALQAHISSAAHAPKIFHCPFVFTPNVKPESPAMIRRFSTLGGLAQHLESGRCEGGVEIYTKAIAFVEDQLRRLGFVNIKLLPEVNSAFEGVL